MERLYLRIRCNRYLNIAVINLRYLIGFGFLPSGIKKIINTPFAGLGNSGPFFEYLDALYYTGAYYNMIGWAQVIAAVLLITQRFATVGAFIFLPVILNITVLTLSTIGSLTPLIATMMLFGVLFLLCWDYYKWINIFSNDNNLIYTQKTHDFPSYNKTWIMTGFGLLIIPSLVFLSVEQLKGISVENNSLALIILLIIILIPIIGFIVDERDFRKSVRLKGLSSK